MHLLQRAGGVFARYELPQYGSRRRLLSPSGMYDEYGEVMVENDGGYYYSPHGPTAEEVSISGTMILSPQQAEATVNLIEWIFIKWVTVLRILHIDQLINSSNPNYRQTTADVCISTSFPFYRNKTVIAKFLLIFTLLFPLTLISASMKSPHSFG